jgi:putative endonuclease
MPNLDAQKKGFSGELIAAAYLEQNNYKIIIRNFHSSRGEIDIVARDQDEIVFVEVKAYSSGNLNDPFQAITRRKQAHIIHAAKTFLLANGFRNFNCRFDVIAVDCNNKLNKIRHIKNAFN